MFEVKICSLSNGFKYFFPLNPSNYKSSDWDWLVDKFEKMLYRWDHRWLTIRGMVIMIQRVFEGIPVYWMHIFRIPQDIINKIKSIVANFLWSGSGSKRRIPLLV